MSEVDDLIAEIQALAVLIGASATDSAVVTELAAKLKIAADKLAANFKTAVAVEVNAAAPLDPTSTST
jgi:hypothetical protein